MIGLDTSINDHQTSLQFYRFIGEGEKSIQYIPRVQVPFECNMTMQEVFRVCAAHLMQYDLQHQKGCSIQVLHQLFCSCFGLFLVGAPSQLAQSSSVILELFFRRYKEWFHCVQQRPLGLAQREQVKQVMGLLKSNMK